MSRFQAQTNAVLDDAIDAQAARFYERFGFARLADEYPCRMVLDLLPLLTTAGTT